MIDKKGDCHQCRIINFLKIFILKKSPLCISVYHVVVNNLYHSNI